MHSPFFAGGAALGAVGGTIAAARKLPSRAWNLLLRNFTIAAEIPDTDNAFRWLQTWIEKQPGSKRIKNLTVNTELGVKGQILLAPAVGSHLLWLNGRVLWLRRDRNEGKESRQKSEYLHLRMIGRNQNLVRELIAEARDTHRKIHKRPDIMIATRDYWTSLGVVPERPLDSVILGDGIMERIVEDAEVFLRSGQWYSTRGVPYRRGYMLAGPPGTGKSSVVTALAHHLKQAVYVINLGGYGMTDDNLVGLLCSVTKGAIVLFEDIDATTRSRVARKKDKEAKEESSVSLSGLLNALDGLTAKEGRIAIMTTNHPEKLDSALVRPGRVDATFVLGHATESQARRMFERFFGEDEKERAGVFAHLTGGKGVAPAVIQEHMLRHRDSASDALNNIGEMLAEAAV